MIARDSASVPRAVQSGLKRHATIALVMMAVLLALFAIVRAADVAVLIDPRPTFAGLGAVAALAAVGLLVADVVLPVPSSLIMVWLGASQGWLAGAALSLAGCVGATVLAFWLGRRGSPLFERLVPPHERARADALLARWGTLAIATTATGADHRRNDGGGRRRITRGELARRADRGGRRQRTVGRGLRPHRRRVARIGRSAGVAAPRRVQLERERVVGQREERRTPARVAQALGAAQ